MRIRAIEKEWMKISKREEQMRRRAVDKESPLWKKKLEEKIPGKVMTGLEKVFCKAFSLVFENGHLILERTYDKESFEKDFKIKDYALDLKGGKREIRNMKRDAARGNRINMLFSAAEGTVLGVLGIGLPDIVIWVGVLLRGVYETALKYGFDYESPVEKMFILKMLETAMSTGPVWTQRNGEVDACMEQKNPVVPSKEDLQRQIEATSAAFVTDMLAMKFIQGLPVVGIVGGAMNPVYYSRVMSYVEIKYRKRYLKGKLEESGTAWDKRSPQGHNFP